MTVVAKLTLFILWLMTFMVTCIVMSITFPVIMLFDKFRAVAKGISI